jgi:hypothetical protein
MLQKRSRAGISITALSIEHDAGLTCAALPADCFLNLQAWPYVLLQIAALSWEVKQTSKSDCDVQFMNASLHVSCDLPVQGCDSPSPTCTNG